jgi:hypothetical protein
MPGKTCGVISNDFAVGTDYRCRGDGSIGSNSMWLRKEISRMTERCGSA